MKTTACRSCGEPMIWCLTEKGKRNPMDSEPSSAGKYRLDEQDNEQGPLAVWAPDYGGERYMSHFSTCPNAQTHRKKEEL